MIDNLCQIMQNKANLFKAQMNVNSFQASDYDDSCRFELAKNKANQSQF